MDNSTAYVACQETLEVYDVTDPYHPVWMGSAGYSGEAQELLVSGNYLYLATAIYSGGLSIYDISTPSVPTLVGGLALEDVYDIAISGDIAYLASRPLMSVVDIADPANPEILSFFTEGWANQLALTGENMYMTGGFCDDVCGHGVFVLDVSDSASPVLVDRRLTESDPWGVAGDDHHAYVVGGGFFTGDNGDEFISGGLSVFEIVNQVELTQVGWYPLPGYQQELAFDDQYVYIGTDYGLYTLEYGYRLGGIVYDVLGEPVADVSISTGDEYAASTGPDGLYEMVNLDPGEHDIRPTLEGYAFYPPARTVQTPGDAAGVNFTLLPEPVSTVLLPGAERAARLHRHPGFANPVRFSARCGRHNHDRDHHPHRR